MIAAIIPARGGSKRIPGKNIKLFMGKPMINYSVEAAVKSGLFERIIVSTDSKEIADIAQRAGAEAPFTRPGELADDFSHVRHTIAHALAWLKEQGDNVRYACCIFPTAPFIRVEDIKKGFQIIEKEKAVSVFTVTTFAYSIFRSFKLDAEGRLQMFWPEREFSRSNDLPEAYHDAGQFYWLDAERFLKDKRFFVQGAVPIVLPRYLVQDIDTSEDWEKAELLYKMLHEKDKK